MLLRNLATIVLFGAQTHGQILPLQVIKSKLVAFLALNTSLRLTLSPKTCLGSDKHIVHQLHHYAQQPRDRPPRHLQGLHLRTSSRFHQASHRCVRMVLPLILRVLSPARHSMQCRPYAKCNIHRSYKAKSSTSPSSAPPLNSVLPLPHFIPG